MPSIEANRFCRLRAMVGRARASCLLGLLLAFGFSSLFSADAYAQQRWDYWGRSVAVTYRVDLSKDDALCSAVVAALNERRVNGRTTLFFGEGEYADRHLEQIPSLYQDPMFVTWMPHELSGRGTIFFQPAEWTTIPLYNDGQDVAVVRVTSVSTHFALQSLVTFDDVESFKTRKWEYRNQLLTDEAGLRLLQKPGTTRYDQPHYIPPPAIPSVLHSKRRWRFSNFDDFGEYDLIRFAERMYVFIRDPARETAVVTEVHRDKSSSTSCFIGSIEDPHAKH